MLKCQLKGIDPRDYRPSFTPEEMLQLRLTFPSGVCDYAKPPANQRPLLGTFLAKPSLSLTR